MDPGIGDRLSSCAGAFMEEAASFGDPKCKKLFARIDPGRATGRCKSSDRGKRRRRAAEMERQLSAAKPRHFIVIPVSRPGHCPHDSLRGPSPGLLDVDVKAVARGAARSHQQRDNGLGVPNPY